MTDRPRPYHRAEAERLLDYADEWAAQAGELSPEASERACLGYAQVHALLAIHDTLTALKPEPVTVTHPWSNPLTVTHPWPPWPSTLPDVDAADRYAANEAEQREAGGRSIRDLVARSSLGTPEVEAARAGVDPEAVRRVLARVAEPAESDPLDEDDHRDRLDSEGDLWGRNLGGCWHTARRNCPGCGRTLAYVNRRYGPLTFAPEPSQEATGGDLTASEGESGSVEGEGADDAPEALLCPECGDHINTHNMNGCRFVLCACPRTPEDVARALIADAVKAERGGRRG